MINLIVGGVACRIEISWYVLYVLMCSLRTLVRYSIALDLLVYYSTGTSSTTMLRFFT